MQKNTKQNHKVVQNHWISIAMKWFRSKHVLVLELQRLIFLNFLIICYFVLFYDILCKQDFHCNNVKKVHAVQIQGTAVHWVLLTFVSVFAHEECVWWHRPSGNNWGVFVSRYSLVFIFLMLSSSLLPSMSQHSVNKCCNEISAMQTVWQCSHTCEPCFSACKMQIEMRQDPADFTQGGGKCKQGWER